MKIALKYGLLITAGIALWIVIIHFVVPVSPDSKVSAFTPVLFNLIEIAAIYLGIKVRKSEVSSPLKVSEGLKTGLSISIVYASSSCVFFLVLLLLAGPKLLASEPGAQTRPLWQTLTMAFAGLFFGAMVLGTIYSLVISFFFARRVKDG